ncbi:MAG: hypothetical protein M9940_01265 [Bacteroidetes bacterium]|nr:MAG: hypothetical protein UZ10_BCD003000449 [Bacteroidetes bacterium OLB10]MBX3107471.1 hypothetical protein [Bacteroidota bacterium]MCB8931387.1 hypothetical protein [Bacteroidia bacterium]MCO5288035.1 hypothetical protein [Bacteroidota bacterium]MCW5930173.1 hypothetical protein [Bacteroidota bacterium]
MIRLILLTAFVVSGCAQPQNDNTLLLQKLDSLQSKLDSLKNEVQQFNQKDSTSYSNRPNEKDSVVQQLVIGKNKQKPVVQPRDSQQIKQKQPAQIKQVQPTPSDERVSGKKFYYKGLPQRISVEISAWDSGRRTIRFYNPFGEITYKIEDVKMSYSSITELKRMHDNGACALIETGMNPGASMYWYETKITFDENNNPLWKEEIEKPEMSIEQNLNNKSWWNAKTKSWIKQEINKEQPVPH